MNSKARWAASGLAAWVLVCGAPAGAQTQADRLIRQYREDRIDLIEEVLFKYTSKTTRVTFLRELVTPLERPAYCGEGWFGSSRQKFLIDLNTGKIGVGVSSENWRKLACESVEGQTLIDLR